MNEVSQLLSLLTAFCGTTDHTDLHCVVPLTTLTCIKSLMCCQADMHVWLTPFCNWCTKPAMVTAFTAFSPSLNAL